MAPKFTAEAPKLPPPRKRTRIGSAAGIRCQPLELKRVGGGLWVTNPRHSPHQLRRFESRLQTPTGPEQEWNDLMFVWNVAKYVKSNAIVFGKGGQTYGIGAGQMSRVDSTRIAARKAQDASLRPQRRCVPLPMPFPFRDGVDVIAEQGIKAIIHPAGSMRDQEVFDARTNTASPWS